MERLPYRSWVRSTLPTARRPSLVTLLCALAIASFSTATIQVRGDRPAAEGSGAEIALTASSRPGIWVSVSEVRALPTTGVSWDQVKRRADGSPGAPKLSDQESNHDVNTLATALVFARTSQSLYRTKARDAIMSAIGTEAGGTSLALARNLVSYVISADLIGLSGDDDVKFRSWLRGVLTQKMQDGRTLRETHEVRPNNWGTHAGASRAAADVYLGDSTDLARAARVFKGWLGDRSSWSGFKFGELSWQCDASRPVGVNAKGCTRDGYPIDGVLPDDQRRAGTFTWPPPKENYVYEALQGAIVQAHILHRAGHATWTWQDNALLRAFRWLHKQAQYPATGDDEWQPWLINRMYGTNFPTAHPARPGKNVGWTDWTHG